VQQVDPAFLFETGDAARSVRRIQEGRDKFETWLNLSATIDAINSCVHQSIYREHFHGPLLNAAAKVTEAAQRYMAKIFPQEGEGESLAAWDITHIQSVYTKFETILISELQSISSYIVTRKAEFDIACMVESGKVFFSKDLEVKVPSAIPDLEQAMRCIAFEVPTAAGFHLHRANESVLRVYWDNVTDGARRPKEHNMGVYLRELNKLDMGDKSVRAHLQSIKDFHRNPLMHPDQSLESVEEAIDLMAAIRCAIGYMLKEIPVPVSPLVAALLGTPSAVSPQLTNP
jgi:hypothetical protein